MAQRPLTVAWISYYPIEWLPELPAALQNLPRIHPAPWQRVLTEEFQNVPNLKLHAIAVRKQFPRHCTFDWGRATFHCLKVPGGMRTLSLFWWETVLIARRLRHIRPDLIHAWGTERGAALVASRLSYRYLVTVQGLLEWYAQEVKLGGYLRFEAYLERVALARARIASAESTFSANFVRQHYPHLDVRRVDVVPDESFHHVQRQPETQPTRFLFLGALGPRKGGDLLLLGLNELEADFKLVVVGTPDPGFLEQWRARISDRTWSRIEFRQHLAPPAVAEELARATILICPTRADTGPMAVKEAAVAGLPVVGSAVGGIPDYIVPEKNGLLFPSGDLAACVAALRQAVKHPLFSQGQVDEATLAGVRRQLSAHGMAQAFLGIYREIAAAPGWR